MSLVLELVAESESVELDSVALVDSWMKLLLTLLLHEYMDGSSLTLVLYMSSVEATVAMVVIVSFVDVSSVSVAVDKVSVAVASIVESVAVAMVVSSVTRSAPSNTCEFKQGNVSSSHSGLSLEHGSEEEVSLFLLGGDVVDMMTSVVVVVAVVDAALVVIVSIVVDDVVFSISEERPLSLVELTETKEDAMDSLLVKVVDKFVMAVGSFIAISLMEDFYGRLTVLQVTLWHDWMDFVCTQDMCFDGLKKLLLNTSTGSNDGIKQSSIRCAVYRYEL